MEKDKSKGTYIVNKEMIVNENLVVEDMPVTMGIQDEISILHCGTYRPTESCCRMFPHSRDLGSTWIRSRSRWLQTEPAPYPSAATTSRGNTLEAELAKQDEFKDIVIDRVSDLAMISLVGVGMATHSGVSGKVFQILTENGIRYYHITTSEISISVTVAMDQKLKAAIALCRAFHL